MTEFEINKKVAQKLGYIYTKSFDPCNKLEQAWEIMLDHDICVTRGDCEDYNAFLLLTLDGYEWFTEKMVSHKKPFVAAMLLFLELD